MPSTPLVFRKLLGKARPTTDGKSGVDLTSLLLKREVAFVAPQTRSCPANLRRQDAIGE